MQCKSRPQAKSFASYRENGDQEVTDVEMPAEGGTGLTGSRASMQSFIDAGVANPSKVKTQREWRELFVKGIIEDDLPFTHGEGRGTKRTLRYTIPRNWVIPEHTQVRRDLDRINEAVNLKLNKLLQVRSSHIIPARYWHISF